MPNREEQQLIYRVSVYADQDAFAALHDQYFDKIYELISFRVGQKEDAEDLSSQVFLKAWEYLTKPNRPPVQNFRAFIYKVARNEVITFYRKQGRLPALIPLENPEGTVLEVEDTRENLFLQQLHASDKAQMLNWVRQLKGDYQEVLILRFFEGLETEEIAEIMDKSPGAVRVLIHRGIQALKKIIVQEL